MNYTQAQIDRANTVSLEEFLRTLLITKLIANTVFKLNCTHN